MSEVVIRTAGLVKRFGEVRALDGLDLAVERGEIFGFIGPNGAGKSTTIRVLLDLLRPTSGRAEVLGVPPEEGGPPLRARIGYLPGELTVPGRRSAGGILHQLAHCRRGAGADRIGPLADRFGLDLDRRARGLSKGNKQKIGVVQAFMHAPELLVLDEPTSGLDPLLQREFLDLVLEARDAGATVFMSSHVLSEVEAVADRVAIIRAGRLVDVDDVRSLRHRAGQVVELQLEGEVDPAAFARLPGVEVTSVTPTGTEDGVDSTTLELLLRGEPDALLRTATAHRVLHWAARDRELEELFLDLYRVPGVAPAGDGGGRDVR